MKMKKALKRRQKPSLDGSHAYYHNDNNLGVKKWDPC